MVMVTMSIAVTVIQLNFHYRSPNTHHMSPFLRKLFLEILPAFLMMKRPTKEEVWNNICFSNTLIIFNSYFKGWGGTKVQKSITSEETTSPGHHWFPVKLFITQHQNQTIGWIHTPDDHHDNQCFNRPDHTPTNGRCFKISYSGRRRWFCSGFDATFQEPAHRWWATTWFGTTNSAAEVAKHVCR